MKNQIKKIKSTVFDYYNGTAEINEKMYTVTITPTKGMKFTTTLRGFKNNVANGVIELIK